MKRNTALIVFLALLGGIACGDETEATTNQTIPSYPTGRITGQILDPHLLPIADVEVKASGDSTKPVKTDADGLFTLTGIADRSTVMLFFTKAGFAPVSALREIDQVISSGDEILPIDNAMTFVGPFVLRPNNYTLTVNVVDERAAPVDAFTATLMVEPSGFDLENMIAIGKQVFTATGSAGTVTFSNIPGPDDSEFFRRFGDYTLAISRVGDSQGPRFHGWNSGYLRASPPPVTIGLSDYENSYPQTSVISSNLAWLMDSEAPASRSLVNEKLEVVFNRPLAGVPVTVRIWPAKSDYFADKYSVLLSPPVAFSINQDRLIIPRTSIASGEAPTVGAKYYVQIEIPIDRDENNWKQTVPFYIGDPKAPESPKSVSFNVYRPEGTAIIGVAAGEEILAVLDQDIGAQTPNNGIPVFASTDLTASGNVGDDDGEIGSGKQLGCANPFEPMASWSESEAVGFTRYFRFASPSNLPANTKLVFLINRPEFCNEGAPQRTVWGASVSSLPSLPEAAITIVPVPVL